MKCVTHNYEAVGVCKVCGRAVCAECADLSNDIIACDKTCRERAQALHDFETWAISESKKSPERWNSHAETYRSAGHTQIAKGGLWLIAAIGCGYVLLVSELIGSIKAAAFFCLVFASVFAGTSLIEYRRWFRMARNLK